MITIGSRLIESAAVACRGVINEIGVQPVAISMLPRVGDRTRAPAFNESITDWAAATRWSHHGEEP